MKGVTDSLNGSVADYEDGASRVNGTETIGTDTYKTTSEAIQNADVNNKKVIKKTLSQMMKQSFFQGANRFGTNFIA